MSFGYCISELRKRDPEKYTVLMKTVNVGILKDFKESYDFWEQYQNPFEPLLKKGYDSYLKANGQAQGIQSYSALVGYVIAYTQNDSFNLNLID